MSESFFLEKCCLIGESVVGNPTHFMVEQAFEDAGIDWRFLTFEVSQTRLVDALRGIAALKFSGAILLPSLQKLSWEHLPAHTERAKTTRSVSCLVEREGRLLGDDLSGESVAAAILRTHPIAGRHAVLLGIGGRGESTALALLQHGVQSLRIADFAGDAPGEFLDRLRGIAPAAMIETLDVENDQLDLPEETDLIVASSSWSKPKDVTVAGLVASSLSPKMVVADARVRSGYSPLLHDAVEAGAHAVTGVQILVEEVAESISQWTGREVSRAVLHDAAEEFLGV
ncbi:MAG: hypothetical protein KDA37_02655 [Planctomycetales bacterium]|nr:hypothetical protein [Planctomycetales bacterium]